MGDTDNDESDTSHLPIRLAIIAECAITHSALRALCASMPNVHIVAQVSSALNGVTEMEAIQPTIVLLSAAFTSDDCLALQQDSEGLARPPSLIAIRIRPRRQTILDLIGGGLLGILDEQAGEKELATALALVAQGEMYLGTHVRSLLSSQPADSVEDVAPVALTPREREVLALVMEGETNDGIARKPHMSVKTVETHLSHIYGKLGVSCRVQAVVRAQELGLLALPPSRPSRQVPVGEKGKRASAAFWDRTPQSQGFP